MIAVTARSLWAHRRRLVATLLAVGLGVAFLAGTLLLSDTLRANFDRLFTQADAGTNVILRSATEVSTGPGGVRAGLDANLLPRVRGVPGVADAQPYLEGFGQLTGRDGKPIGGNGPPTQAANWVADPALNSYRLVAGHAPRADDEVVVNRGAATAGHLTLGATTTLLTPQPLRVRIVGIATFGTADGFGSGTFTGMTLHAAQLHLTGSSPAKVTQILVRASPGVTPGELAARLRAALPAGVQAITGTQLAAENLDEINSGFLGFLSAGLTLFAAIALLVAAFSIYNTFAILAVQRGRETALLRALGASRRQLVVAGLAETLAVGIAGSAAGWAGGIGIAALLKGVFDGFGFALPAGGLVLKASSAIVAVTAGVAATVLAGVLPVLRSSRLPALAALREHAAEPGRVSRTRSVLGLVVTAGGAAAVIAGATGGGEGLAVAGAAGTLAGFIVLGPVAVRPAAAVLGAPAAARRSFGGAGLGGRLARDNALRHPRRTAATAAALMVGVSVAALFTVIGASMKASAAQGVDRTLTADLVVDQGGYGGRAGLAGLSPQLAASLGRLPAAGTVTAVNRGSVLLDGTSQTIAAADPRRIGAVLNLGVTAGSLGSLDAGSLAVSATAAADRHWRVGSTVPVVYPDGSRARLRIAAVFGHPEITGDYLLAQSGWEAHAGQALDAMILLELKPGASAASAQAAVTAVTAAAGQPRVQDRDQYLANATSGVNTILGLVYVMLALAILIALMGVANTLSLSIHERTRELGLLRALGQTRTQARGMIRWESVIVATFGTLGGVILGTFLGWAVVSASASAGLAVFSASPVQLALFLVLGVLTGVAAGIRPARRAARLNPLTAIAAT
ncbi:MAG TPA: ABC transporter permease [Streptosporangiaceae bacterium]|nr:ABC transporter permease [Streptosporangiaceae bacterium]